MPVNSRSNTFGVADAKRLLDGWSAYQNKLYQEQGPKHQEFLVRFLKELQPFEFDCCDIGGWHPNENELSNVIAAIFNPRRQHGFAGASLDALLDLIAAKTSLGSVKETIAYIKALKPEDKYELKVIREGAGEVSRSDIELVGRNFLICIEHKLRGVAETTHENGQAQTVRLLKDVKKKLASDTQPVIGILLSPEGKPAVSEQFTAIKFGELATAVASAISNSWKPAAASIRGFMAYYGRRF